VEDDGLLVSDVGPWARDKYRRVGMYAELFSTGMKRRWDSRVYLDLFAGPGYARLRGTRKIVLSSPILALSLPDPFDRYILLDENPAAIAALEQRVRRRKPAVDAHFLIGDVNARTADIIDRIPQTGRVLSFCFLDPYKLNLHFDTVQQLAAGRAMDFLILLALHVDANRNIELYVQDESDVIDRFLGDPSWRERWERERAGGGGVVPFLAEEYAGRMASIGYMPMKLKDMVKIRTHERRLPLYYLAFFSKNRKGIEFWREVLRYSDEQTRLEL